MHDKISIQSIKRSLPAIAMCGPDWYTVFTQRTQFDYCGKDRESSHPRFPKDAVVYPETATMQATKRPTVIRAQTKLAPS